MPNITLSVSKELHEKMKKHSEYKWSEVARKSIEEKITEAELIDDLKAIREAEKEYAEGKTTSLKKALKEMEL